MILDIYKDSLEYSAKDWKTLVILGVICLFSVFLLPVFLITGYNYRVINTAVHGVINGKDPLPEFDNIIEMFVDGIKVFVVQVAYMLVPVIIFFIFAAIASNVNKTASIALMIIGCIITFAVGIAACLMSQMGICHMAYNDGSFSKAFALTEIKEAIDDIGWFNCIITYLGLIIITVVIAFVVTSIIYIIFGVFGISSLALGVDPTGIILVGALINALITMFIVGPYLSIFNSRSIGLLYSMQI
ncbi:DUF4013 domain-containing protein [Methanobrevibacter millerae]|uniref:DUF4013 domain-containing protein n=1 Tax=Methanobrevibacter millerae TaxID=230361 RepID=A0A1G5VD22_9EURY|nr:DUF4013 domain-containing protein [Methanobrevibacter millerae]SDA43749.1 Protein of unknown function [Methanobrevibacter millerae]